MTTESEHADALVDQLAAGLLDALEREDATLDAGLRKAARLRELEWRVVANAGRLSESVRPRWSRVAQATGYGSMEAREMCIRAGFHPDKLVGGQTIDG